MSGIQHVKDSERSEQFCPYPPVQKKGIPIHTLYIAIQMVVVRVCKSLNVDRVEDGYYPQAPAAFHVRIPQILHPPVSFSYSFALVNSPPGKRFPLQFPYAGLTSISATDAQPRCAQMSIPTRPHRKESLSRTS